MSPNQPSLIVRVPLELPPDPSHPSERGQLVEAEVVLHEHLSAVSDPPVSACERSPEPAGVR